MIVILNGAFGIGKTTVAREVIRRLPGSILFDPELLGIPIQRAGRAFGREVDDFQDLRLWRHLVVLALRVARRLRPTVVVPIGISNASYLEEILNRLQSLESPLLHLCLVAPIDVVHARLEGRGADRDRNSWEFARARECCDAHVRPEFARQIDASGDVDIVVDRVVAAIDAFGRSRS